MRQVPDIARFTEAAQSALDQLPAASRDLGKSRHDRGAISGDIDLLESGFLSARVQGADGAYYVVSGRVTGTLTCSCSWRVACEHVAAVLWSVILEATKVRAAPAAPPAKAKPAAARKAKSPAVPTPPTPPAEEAQVERWLASLGDTPARSRAQRDIGDLVFLLDLDGEPATIQLGRRLSADPGPRPLVSVLPQGEAKRVLAGTVDREGLDAALDSVSWSARAVAEIKGRLGAFSLGELVKTGRLLLKRSPAQSGGAYFNTLRLSAGSPRQGTLTWQELESGELRTHIDLGRPALLVRTLPPVCIDPTTGQAAAVQTDGDVEKWFAAPRIQRPTLQKVAKALARRPYGLPPPRTKPVRAVGGEPTGHLVLFQEPAQTPGPDQTLPWGGRFARLFVRYEDVELPAGKFEARSIVDRGKLEVHVNRDQYAENMIEGALYGAKFFTPMYRDQSNRWLLDSEADWVEFMLEGARELEAYGIEVSVDASFTLSVVEVDDFSAELEASDNDWFEFSFGIEVDSERIDFLPLLLSSLEVRGAPRAGAPLAVPLPSGKIARVPYSRVEPLLHVLLELVHQKHAGKARVSRWQAMDLAELFALESKTGTALRELKSALARTTELPKCRAPRKFRATLREYQQDGLNWLAFLAQHSIGGVLADDMGLGKTVQVIALICSRQAKAAGGLPSLVVAPTSVLLSWQDQLKQFAPHLKLVAWHGKERFSARKELAQADLVLTSYTLLRRDIEELREISWDVVVLDEAQAIKNPKAMAGTAARSLTAKQRLAVTGTPLENHLGELWSLFAFIAPGVLGSERSFRAAFRTPIEKQGDSGRMEALRRRVAPLLLRRTKEEVATELPPKTIVELPIELGTAQRDLYETVRQSVDKRVREEIAKKGIALSKIVVLDALLKLRQVCCDPALLKVLAPQKRVASAKREAFMELLETLMAEGRKVLVFSQFVEMLNLLGADLEHAGISYARLTGSTVDRAGEVDRFQSGKVPVFLISLKAGGVGLNLTAADTVIHYDPWWNPAVEAQATDRAHRIGQDKPVFVHRLIVRGSVEEKIVALQAKKAELASALLEGGTGALKLDEALVDELLAPMPRGIN